jgi:hypothetical protein
MAFSHENYRDVDPDPEPSATHDNCRSCRTPLTDCLNAREAFNERCCGSCQMVDTHFPLEKDMTDADKQPRGTYTLRLDGMNAERAMELLRKLRAEGYKAEYV